MQELDTDMETLKGASGCEATFLIYTLGRDISILGLQHPIWSSLLTQPLGHAWVLADLDRYIRKPGTRSIQDTRYQTRLEGKVEELARVFCSEEFMQDIYATLSQDRVFVKMLQSGIWSFLRTCYVSIV